MEEDIQDYRLRYPVTNEHQMIEETNESTVSSNFAFEHEKESFLSNPRNIIFILLTICISASLFLAMFVIFTKPEAIIVLFEKYEIAEKIENSPLTSLLGFENIDESSATGIDQETKKKIEYYSFQVKPATNSSEPVVKQSKDASSSGEH